MEMALDAHPAACINPANVGELQRDSWMVNERDIDLILISKHKMVVSRTPTQVQGLSLGPKQRLWNTDKFHRYGNLGLCYT